MVIRIPSQKLVAIDYRAWEPFQGDLKILYKKNYDKLKKSFEENGGFLPAFIWVDRDINGDVHYRIMDAHQRKELFEREGATFLWDDRPGEPETYEYPCYLIEADTAEEAAKKLLVITSQYGTIVQEGLDKYAAVFGIDDDWMAETTNYDNVFTELPELDFDDFATDQGDDSRVDPQIKEPTEPKIKEPTDPNGYPAADIEDNGIALIQLFVKRENEKAFRDMADQLKVKFETTTLTETIFEAMKFASK